MGNLPFYIYLLFITTVLFCLFLMYRGINRSAISLIIVLTWLLVQGLIAVKGFYFRPRIEPQHFLLLLLPPMITVILICFSPAAKVFRDKCDQRWLTSVHSVRIGVECVLYLLYMQKQVPKLITLAGNNYDLLTGLTAPLIVYFGYIKKILSNRVLLIWNFIGLCLLLNVLIEAILSAPFSFHQLARDQPNIAVFYFPFIWLPGFIVPVVLFCHLISIRKLLNGHTP
jgi:hypothetical protein